MLGTVRSVDFAGVLLAASTGLLIPSRFLLDSDNSYHPLVCTSAFQLSEMVGEKWRRQILLNLFITKVQTCVRRNAQTLGF